MPKIGPKIIKNDQKLKFKLSILIFETETELFVIQ